MLLNLTL